MLPCPCANITRSSCFMLSSVPSTLVSKVALYVSADCSVTGPGVPSVPALLTAASSLPKRATALSTSPRTSSSRRTSARRNSASAPSSRSSAINRFPSSSCRPDTTTRAPSVAKARAVARPIPVSAPVINTTGVFMSSSSVWVRRTALRPGAHRNDRAAPIPIHHSPSRVVVEPKFSTDRSPVEDQQRRRGGRVQPALDVRQARLGECRTSSEGTHVAFGAQESGVAGDRLVIRDLQLQRRVTLGRRQARMHRTPAGGIEQRGSVAAVHRTDGVVGVLPRRARENGPAGFDLDEIEVERHENARFASGGYQRAHLRQAVETVTDFFREAHVPPSRLRHRCFRDQRPG